MNCVKTREIIEYVAGSLQARRAARVEEHLLVCPRCTRVHDEFRATAGALAADPGEFDEPELAKDVITLIDLGQAAPEKMGTRPPDRRWWILVPAGVTALVIALVLLLPRIHQEETSGLRSRSGGAGEASRWSSIRVFRATAAGYEPAGRELSPGNALAFTCDNRPASTYGFLMVFGVDRVGQVYWYYPAFTDEKDNPESIPIQKTTRPYQLPDQVRHELRPGSLRIFALFSPRPLKVKSVEALVARELIEAQSVERLDRLSIEATGQQSFLFEVRADPGGE